MRTAVCHSRWQGTLETWKEQERPAGLPCLPPRCCFSGLRGGAWDGEIVF